MTTYDILIDLAGGYDHDDEPHVAEDADDWADQEWRDAMDEAMDLVALERGWAMQPVMASGDGEFPF